MFLCCLNGFFTKPKDAFNFWSRWARVFSSKHKQRSLMLEKIGLDRLSVKFKTDRKPSQLFIYVASLHEIFFIFEKNKHFIWICYLQLKCRKYFIAIVELKLLIFCVQSQFVLPEKYSGFWYLSFYTYFIVHLDSKFIIFVRKVDSLII